MIIDNFLSNFDELKTVSSQADYSGTVNPVDGLMYPDVSIDIPDSVVTEVHELLSEYLGRSADVHMMFMRLTSENTDGAPHQAHNDTIMGENTMLLYVNDGPGGTSLVTHKETGMCSDPVDQEEWDIWHRDTNKPEAWEITEMVSMKANRAFILDSHLMHRAEPPSKGFGKGPADGRLVLTAFFS